jgi:hypothetical protein
MHNFYFKKKSFQTVPLLLYFLKTDQSKLSPDGRKFGQSGGPGPDQCDKMFDQNSPEM